MTKILEVKNISFGYGRETILEDVSLELNRGDYLGLIGPNGSAKSTLIKLVLGILKPHRGSIKLFGEDIRKFKQWERVGYVSQKATSFNKKFPATVEEILEVSLRSKDRTAVDHALDIVGMDGFKKRLIGHLSGGQQQRVFIAKALISQPELLLLDEPTVGIDLSSQELFYGILEDLNKRYGMTIVLVSHDIGAVTKRVNRIACMGNKRLYSDCMGPSLDVHQMIGKVYGEKIRLIDHHHW